MKSIVSIIIVFMVMSCGLSDKLVSEKNDSLLTGSYFFFLVMNDSPVLATKGIENVFTSDIVSEDITEAHIASIVESPDFKKSSNFAIVIFRIDPVNHYPAYLLVSESIYQQADNFFVGYVKDEYEFFSQGLGDKKICELILKKGNNSLLGEYQKVKVTISNHHLFLFSLFDSLLPAELTP